MNKFLVLTFLFCIGSFFGWILELLWRRFFSKNNPEKKWINPGFLVGPYLPLYGFSLCILFIFSYIDVAFIKNHYLQDVCLFLLMSFFITLIEYITGLIFTKGMKIKLWDYSSCKGNIQGIVCPQYSFYWILLSAFYYFMIHPKILSWLFWFTNHLSFSFVIGFFYGVFFIDIFYSFNLLGKIKKIAIEHKIIVKIDLLKQEIAKLNDEMKIKSHFLFSFKSEKKSLSDILKIFHEKNSH